MKLLTPFPNLALPSSASDLTEPRGRRMERGVVRLIPEAEGPGARVASPRRPAAFGADDPFEPLSDSFNDDDRIAILPVRDEGELPKFMPLQAVAYGSVRDPWTIRSIADLFRVHLMELSISAGLVAISGVLAGQIVAKYAGGAAMEWTVAGYLALYLLNLLTVFLWARKQSSHATRERFSWIMVRSIILCGVHLVPAVFLKVLG